MTAKKTKVSASDRDILRSRTSTAPVADVDDDELEVDDLGNSEESIIKAMNGVFRDLSRGRIQKDSADPMISAARVTLNAVKSRDAKQKIAMLEQLLRDAQAVANAGLQRQAEDRLHTRRDAPDPNDD